MTKLIHNVFLENYTHLHNIDLPKLKLKQRIKKINKIKKIINNGNNLENP